MSISNSDAQMARVASDAKPICLSFHNIFSVPSEVPFFLRIPAIVIKINGL